jgi:mono/diheme cytochrome c family protein
MTFRLYLVFSISALLPLSAAPNGAEAKAIFHKRCTACHTYGRGVKVGPDLKGVTERRQREWLLKFINSSSKMIRSGDTTANELFTKFKRERMPDWSDLSAQQVNAILDWFASNGPEQKEPDERNALTASAVDIESGRRLFHGRAPFAKGQHACATCHAVRGEWAYRGSLGPQLATAYTRYQDRALTDFLKHPCIPHLSADAAHGALMPQEVFDLKSYLAFESGLKIPVVTSPPSQMHTAGADAPPNRPVGGSL